MSGGSFSLKKGFDVYDTVFLKKACMTPRRIPGRRFCPLEKNKPQYPLLSIKGDKKEQNIGKLYLETVYKELLRAVNLV